MNDFFIFHFLFTVYYEKGNNYSYARLVKKPHRSSCLEGFHKTGVNENFPKFTGTHLCRSLVLINVFYGTLLVLPKTESLFPDSLYSGSSFHLCIVVFTYLSSNILLQRIVLDFQ